MIRTGKARRRLLAAATFVLIAGCGFVVATLLDQPIYAYFDRRGWKPPTDWDFMFRIAGYLPFWLLIAVALFLIDRRSHGRQELSTRRCAGLLTLTVIVAGLLSEALKLLIRRERPLDHAGEYFFRAWSHRTFDAGGLALPSGHATIALAACFLLYRLYPRASPVWMLAGLGCAYGRVATRAHFVSDVWLSGVVGFLVATIVWHRLAMRRRQQGTVG